MWYCSSQPEFFRRSTFLVFFSGIEGAVGGISIEANGATASAGSEAADLVRTYQNQTAEDIESGRARMDSVTSCGSGGSEDALLPEVRVATSPRRTNRENLPLLRGRGRQRVQEYEDIDDLESLNVFPGTVIHIIIDP